MSASTTHQELSWGSFGGGTWKNHKRHPVTFFVVLYRVTNSVCKHEKLCEISIIDKIEVQTAMAPTNSKMFCASDIKIVCCCVQNLQLLHKAFIASSLLMLS